MGNIVRNVLSVLIGAFIGGMINGKIIAISGDVVPLPVGADVTTMEGLKASLPLFQPINFLMPFLAHALGSFFGAIIAYFISNEPKMRSALLVGFMFLLGGIYMVIKVPAPLWFSILDLVVAYIPMAFLGGKLAGLVKSAFFKN